MRYRVKSLQERVREPSLTVLLVFQLFIIFAVGPLFSCGINISPDVLIGGFVIVVGFVVVASRELRPTILVIAALFLSGAAVIMREINENALTDWLGGGGGVFAVGSISWVVAKALSAPGRMSAHRIVGAIVLYLNFAIMFTVLFRLIAERVPGSFSGIPAQFMHGTSIGDLMYFSITTLTTVGYGDITPVNPVARSLSNLEAIIGQLYPAIILARIITLYTPKAGPEK
ncbi:MAG: potassium channel family protein [Acidocella sp.]|uniref:potassium channel family protein n=1 Tax=Acidocella sp. TaxID=50710 RepID=UPI003FD82B55